MIPTAPIQIPVKPPGLNAPLVRHPAEAAAQQPSRHQQLTAQTQKWVAQTFYGTMLQQMRKSPFKSDLSDGGHGGEAFSTMLDQRLADHMSHAAGKKLVDSIVNKLEHAHAAKKYQHASKLGTTSAARHAAQLPTSKHSAPKRTTRGLKDALHQLHSLAKRKGLI